MRRGEVEQFFDLSFHLGFTDRATGIRRGSDQSLLDRCCVTGDPPANGSACVNRLCPLTPVIVQPGRLRRRAHRILERPFRYLSPGQGVDVAVLGTGIDAAHPDFAGRMAAAESCATWPWTCDS